MLYAMWHASGELEGHGQQGMSCLSVVLMTDAHSFFLAALDQIHAHAKGQLSSCNCIARGFLTKTELRPDQTFSGALLSSVTCSSCRKKSSTVDPILDIQLDFPSHSTETISLASLLRRFCAEESLGEGKGYDCSDCGAGQSATRRLVLKKLPPVLSFQLKVSTACSDAA
jgi:ubiquitin carboxyl-terminal hydrolase 22/27/51